MKYLLALALAVVGSAQVSQSLQQLGNTGNYAVSFTWTADGSGVVPMTAAQLGAASLSAQGLRILQVQTVPLSPAPTNNYTVQIIDAFGGDMMGGALASVSSSVVQYFAATSATPPIIGAFSLKITGNSVAGAQGKTIVYFGPQSLINSNAGAPGPAGPTGPTGPAGPTGGGPASATFNFTAQTPGGSLSAGVGATVTLTPCPSGVNGADSSHWLYVSGGTGTAEAVLITGGTCTSGASSGTVIFTPTNSHTGAWTIASATAGIQEAIVATSGPGVVTISPGNLTINAPITTVAGGQCITLQGYGVNASVLRQNFTSGNLINYNGCSDPVGQIQNIGFLPLASVASGYQVYVKNVADVFVSNLEMRNVYGGLAVENSAAPTVSSVRVNNNTGNAFLVLGSTGASGGIYSGLTCSANPAAPTCMLVQTTGTASIAGIRFDELNLTTAANLLQFEPAAGTAINEVSVFNSIFDGWTSRQIFLHSAGGSGTHYKFHGVTGASVTAAINGIDIGAAYKDIEIVGAQIQSTAADIVLRGASGVKISASTLYGIGTGVAGNYALQLTTEGGTPVTGLTVTGSTIGLGHDGTTGSNYATNGIVVDAAAHTGILIAGNQVYGSSSGLNYSGTGSMVLRDNIFSNTTQPSCAATLRQSTWYTVSAPGTADAYEICTKDAANAYGWRALY